MEDVAAEEVVATTTTTEVVAGGAGVSSGGKKKGKTRGGVKKANDRQNRWKVAEVHRRIWRTVLGGENEGGVT